MEEFSERHRLFVANYFTGKVKELRYQLAIIVAGCDISLNLFTNGSEVPPTNSQAVIYGFSAFTNVIQTLKDAVKTVTGEQLDWSKIELLRYGSFMRNVRNAATHDGNPVISAWADGRYFVPAKIVRIDGYGNTIEIPAPTEDVRAVCLDFSKDFCQLLRDTLVAAGSIEHLRGSRFKIEEVEDALANSTLIPPIAREFFAKNREQIEADLKEIKHDPIADAVKELGEVIQYCDSVTGS
ncbi:hypothetical protein [Pseudomonas rhodesiae]|uniref:hypothetical protein n=1 Tax=Pseudomonas rhodesiae TaxID=76760 RepID=UPI001F443F59|nr:hypothetical protein [Pseudomonas rhodesiae]